MNSGFRKILRRGALALTLLVTSFGLGRICRAQQPPAGAPAGAPRQSHAKPGTTAPTGAPIQSAPAHATPLAGSISPAIHPLPSSASVVGRKTPSGEQFFIVASIDLQKSQLLLKYPTEVTLLVLVNDATKFTDESGKPLKLSDFRAGDTVWMTSTTGKGAEATALRVRKGEMTVADLHRFYLDYEEIK